MSLNEKSIEKVREYIALGRDGKWTWGKLLAEILEIEGISVGNRLKRIQEIATHTLRGSYSTRESVWDAAWKGDPAEVRINCVHVVELCKFEANFDLANRPEPPAAPVPAPAAEGAEGTNGEGKGKKGKKAKAEAGAAPPAPPAAPAAPPAPPAPPSA